MLYARLVIRLLGAASSSFHHLYPHTDTHTHTLLTAVVSAGLWNAQKGEYYMNQPRANRGSHSSTVQMHKPKRAFYRQSLGRSRFPQPDVFTFRDILYILVVSVGKCVFLEAGGGRRRQKQTKRSQLRRPLSVLKGPARVLMRRRTQAQFTQVPN